MKTIKKISVTPLPKNEGKIIDSFNTTDDKHINAPSIDAVNNGLSGKANVSHNHDDRYYTSNDIDLMFDNYKLKDDFAIITGSMTLDPNTSETLNADKWTQTIKNISYPTGFNKDNCVPISIGGEGNTANGMSYGFTSGIGNALTVMNNAFPRTVNLTSSNIVLRVGNYSTDSKTYNYKIVLMKI